MSEQALTIEQQRALALARARRRRAEAEQGAAPEAPAAQPEPGMLDKAGMLAKGALGIPQTTEGFSGAELIAGNPYVRFVKGVGKPVTAALQMVPGPVGETWRQNAIDNAAITERGREAYMESGEALDLLDIGGQAMSPAAIKVMKSLPGASTLLQKMGVGAGTGAVLGAATPVETEGDFADQKLKQIGTAATVGGAIPGVAHAGRATGRVFQEFADLFSREGPARIGRRYLNEVIGPENVDKVARALSEAKELVPGSKPTAAEALVGTPAGSPVAASQQIVARTAGGVSSDFGERAVQNEVARKAARLARDAVTKPMRDAAFQSVDQAGVTIQPITQRIEQILNTPGLRADDVVKSTLKSTLSKLSSLADDTTGKINAEDLYAVRKKIGTVIGKFSKESQSWDKKLSARLEREIQLAIDDAVEAAGGKGWKEYLRTYADLSKNISDDALRAKNQYRQPQRTSLPGGDKVTETETVTFPNLLSRPVMLANAILRFTKGNVEPKVDRFLADAYLDPAALGKALERMPSVQRQKIVDELMARSGALPALATAQQE